MRKFLVLALSFLAIALIASPANAQAVRTWVSGIGDDANTCSRTAPCKTFGAAISKTQVDGEINCLDSGGFGAVKVLKSITIDCHDVFGGVTGPALDPAIAIEISFDAFAGDDAHKTVNLRNVTLNGAGSGDYGIRINGDGTGSSVHIENCLINGYYSHSATGISDTRTNGILFIDSTTVRNNGSNGIIISGGNLKAMISNTRVIRSGTGINAGLNAEVEITGSQILNNNVVGLIVSSTSAVMNVDSTKISFNLTGMQNSGSLRLSNSDVMFNTTAVSGNITSFVSSRFINNPTLGTITPNAVLAR